MARLVRDALEQVGVEAGTDRTTLVKVGGQWTHLFGSSVEANINGGWVQSFGTRSGIVASVTGDGTISVRCGPRRQ